MTRSVVLAALGVALLGTTLSFSFESTVRWDDTHQRMTGYGASCAWIAGGIQGMSEPARTNLMDKFFDTTSGAGLSMVRTQIRPQIESAPGSWNWDQDGGQVWFMQEAMKRGVDMIWAAPWTPPVWMKSSNSTHGDAYLLPEYYQAYADYLSTYVREYKSRFGITIRGVSVQNEPHFVSPWDGNPMSGNQIRDFIKYNMGPTFERDGVDAMIIAPESNWHQRAWADPIFQDPEASAYTSVAAFHEYETSSTAAYPLAKNQGKQLWQSEACEIYGDSPGMAGAIHWVKLLHGHHTEAEVNAWHYWWFYSDKNGEGLVKPSGESKRLWVMGNWSKFVRPGWYMIGADYNSPDGNVGVSAFKYEQGGNIAIVAVNLDQNASAPLQINLDGFNCATVTPWLTDETHDLEAQSPITLQGTTTFSTTLPPWSVTTFVGKGDMRAPTDARIDSFKIVPSVITLGETAQLQWGTSNATSVSIDNGVGTVAGQGTRDLSPSQTTTYRITVDGPGGAYSRTTSLTVNIPREPDNPSPVVNGINYGLYEGSWTAVPNFSASTPNSTGTLTNFTSVIASGPQDNYALYFQGYVNVPADGLYTFYTSSDDGSLLWIGDTRVVANDGAHSIAEQSGQIALKAGMHAIGVGYLEISGISALQVRWECTDAGIAKQLIPSNRLFIPGDPGAFAVDRHGSVGTTRLAQKVQVFDIRGKLVAREAGASGMTGPAAGIVVIVPESNYRAASRRIVR